MSVTVGPTSWWLRSKEAADYYARICPVGTILGDGSAVWCKTLGQAWIVAPNSTQISDQWASGRYNSTCVSLTPSIEICRICEWPNVCSRLISCGFNPCDWFIPNLTILFNSNFCRAFWDTSLSEQYWSSSECNVSAACFICFAAPVQTFFAHDKSCAWYVRSVRCINL